MDARQRQLLLAEIQTDLARHEEEVKKLRLLVEYLGGESAREPVSTSPGQASKLNPATTPPVMHGTRLDDGVTQVGAAEIVLRDAGKGHLMTAREIAQAMVDRGYPREASNDFTATVHTAMKRKPHIFARVGRGQWTLQEFCTNEQEGQAEKDVRRAASRNAATRPPRPRTSLPGSSNRDRVLGIIAQDWLTTDEIVEQTGLTVKQIQGVLTARDLKDRVERRAGDNGPVAYHLREEGSDVAPGAPAMGAAH